ncbi:MAG TPA: DUF1989 domain-containing protein [Burkholderiales bacterium]|nr:DUF1989 domain-containing protein [Burkholderiales bacterium]
MIEEFAVPRGAGKAFTLDRGRLVRLIQIEGGGQVVDLTVFNRHNPDERLWGPKTAWEHGLYPAVGAPLLSTGPWEEPLLTLLADTLPREPTPKGARFHDLLGGCCSRKSHMRRRGVRHPGASCRRYFQPLHAHRLRERLSVPRAERCSRERLRRAASGEGCRHCHIDLPRPVQPASQPWHTHRDSMTK